MRWRDGTSTRAVTAINASARRVKVLAPKTLAEHICRGVQPTQLLGMSLLLLLTGLDLESMTDGLQERLKMCEEIFLLDTGLPIEQEEQLAFHEVDLGDGEAEPAIPLDGGVPRPVLVLGAGVIEVLRGQDQAGEEDAVDGAAHALCNGGQTGAQPGQVHQGGHEGGRLHLRPRDERSNEGLDRGQGGHAVVHALIQGGCAGRCWLLGVHDRGFAPDDLGCLTSQIRDHVARHREVHEVLERGLIERLHVDIHGVGGSKRLMDHAALEERWDKYGHHNQNRRETPVSCMSMYTRKESETRACCFGGAGQRMRQWALLCSRHRCQCLQCQLTALTDRFVSFCNSRPAGRNETDDWEMN